MVFYAYVTGLNPTNQYWTYRYTIVFASRAVADEWWRAVSTSAVGKFASSVQRVNAQFYTHDVTQADAADSLITAGVANQFFGKMFFTSICDQNGLESMSIVPSFDSVDHISGQSFFIRSNVSPYEYWYCPMQETKSVYVSRTERTRFRVSRDKEGTAGTVMIGSDEIIITLTAVNWSINIAAESGKVMVSNTPMSGLKFGDFLSKFAVGTNLYMGGKSLDMKELFYTEHGEEWSLLELLSFDITKGSIGLLVGINIGI
ncbi:hypothetical protein BDR07DRAFT_1464236 [Suillus spraguei]|nr:hypothetical protein BDR07DRAFT_1464236 [Suillus spraguei]